MKEEILKIKEETVGLIDNASDLKSLEDIRVKVLPAETILIGGFCAFIVLICTLDVCGLSTVLSSK